MFYVLNSKEKIKNNDPYKIALKGLMSEIKKIDFMQSEIPDCDSNGMTMDSVVSWVLSNQESMTTKSLEKRIKNLCKTYSTEQMYYMYITTISDMLTEEFMLETAKNNGVDLKKELDNYNAIIVGLNVRVLVGMLCAYVLIIKEQLLDRKIESMHVDDDYKKTRIVKSLRKERFSLYKGVRGIPLILSENEANLLNGLRERLLIEGKEIDILNHAQIIYSYRYLDVLVSKYCFGTESEKAVEVKEFVGEQAFRISEMKLFISPANAFNMRKVIPGEEGVILKVENHSSIESIYLSECSRFNLRIIYGVVRYKDGMECPISLRMSSNSCVTLHCYKANDVMSLIIDYYKIPQEALTELGELPSPSKYEVISGHYWYLRKEGYETNSEKEMRESGAKVKRKYAVKAGTYIRKIKGEASEEAKRFASQLRLTLSDGTTIVREKCRNYFRETEKVDVL